MNASEFAPRAVTVLVSGAAFAILLLRAHTSKKTAKATTKPSAVERLRSMKVLANEYWAIRHGESEANVAALVSSDPILARKQHGLTTKGQEDARKGAEAILTGISTSSSSSQQPVIVIHSPFLRTKETALVVSKVLKGSYLEEEELLRERFFGVFEGKNSHESYGQVWAQDEINGCFNNGFGCESVYDVSERAARVILKWEEAFPNGNRQVVFVSHGDILQIMRSTLNRTVDPKMHRHGEHINPGQAIQLQLS